MKTSLNSEILISWFDTRQHSHAIDVSVAFLFEEERMKLDIIQSRFDTRHIMINVTGKVLNYRMSDIQVPISRRKI